MTACVQVLTALLLVKCTVFNKTLNDDWPHQTKKQLTHMYDNARVFLTRDVVTGRTKLLKYPALIFVSLSLSQQEVYEEAIQ